MPLPLLAPGRCALLPPQLFGSVGYYAVLAAYPEAIIDLEMRYDKRFKSTHRCRIVDTRGPLDLTAAISHEAHRAMPWSQVRVSTHGRWWHQMRLSLESAYGRTPFFEFYIDRFAPLMRERTVDSCETVGELCRTADTLLRQALGITTKVEYTPCAVPQGYDDLRRYDFGSVTIPQYYQVRADRLGFIEGLSALDLLFNLGPEAQLWLAQAHIPGIWPPEP